MSGYIPSPADYAGFLLAARQQHLLLLQHLQRPPPASPARRTQSSSGALSPAPPDPKDLVPLQPLLPDWMANAFGIPLLNTSVGECSGVPRAPVPVPPPYAIPSALWGNLRPMVPPPVPLGSPGHRPPHNLMEQQFMVPPGMAFARPTSAQFASGAQPGHPPPFPFSPNPEPSPTIDPKDANPCTTAGSFRGLLIPPVPHLPPVGTVLQSIARPPPGQTMAKLKRPAEKTRENDLEGGHGEYPMKRTRLVWTPHLHRLFVEAVEKLGEDAVPKNIMQVMDVEGLTRSNVASHLQKYRLQLKKQPRNASRRTPTMDDTKPGAKLSKLSEQMTSSENGRHVGGVAPSLACAMEGNATNADECRQDHALGSHPSENERNDEVHPPVGLSDDVTNTMMRTACAKCSPVGGDIDSKTGNTAGRRKQGGKERTSSMEMLSCTKRVVKDDPHQRNDAEKLRPGTAGSTHDFNSDPGPAC